MNYLVKRMMKPLMKTVIASSGLVLMLASPSQAQISPEENIKKILQAIDEEMREIDRLLMESSRRDAAGGMEKAAERLKDLMQQGQVTQDQVVQDITKLIEELESMQSNNQQSSQGQQQSQSDQSGQKPGDQQRSTRQNNRTPEMVDQGGQDQKQQGENQPQQGEKPQDARDQAFQEGENKPAGARPEDGTERVERDSEDARWGDLPKYARFLMNRGALPEVPEKYRRLVEAYQKQSHKAGSDKSGRSGR
ncbi:MAG: hypothetical protein ACYTG5_12415 [Planctomycetota bacterium]|jgi:hypothetical protein